MWIFLILNIAVTGTVGWEIVPPDPVVVQADTLVDFIYYPQKIPWIAARRVCQSLGGDFAKIDSEELLETILQVADNNYGYHIFPEEYWVGLVELEEDNHFWVSDCSNLTYTSKYTGTLDATKLCFRIKHHDPYAAEKRKCTESNGFMCQILSGNPCIMTGRLNGEVLSVGTNESSCQSKCTADTRCWGSVDYIPDNCVTLALPGYGVQSLNFATKSCHNVTLNTTTVIPNTTGTSDTPNATCGSFVISPTSSNSTLVAVTSIGAAPCEPVNITQNVTVTTTLHSSVSINQTFTTTTTEQFTVTTNLTVTEHSTLTSTESLTTTTVSMTTTTMTSVNTEYVYINSTHTSTVLLTSTRNVTTEEAEEIALEIVKNLTIDTKSTSAHTRRLTSAQDNRQSAVFVGYVGVIFVIVPLGLMLIADAKKMFLDFRSHEHIYNRKTKNN